MEKLIDNSNYFELENWIKSTNPIKLAYGYVGFKILEKKGYELTTEQIKLMLEISEKDYLDLNVCATCVYHDKLTLQEIINWDDTMYFIKNYSKK